MGYFTAIIILGIFAYAAYRFINNRNIIDLHEEKAEVTANLESSLEELEELNELIIQEQMEKEEEPHRPLRILKRKVASKKVAVQNTLGKVEIEGELNWDYRKLQAERTIEAAKELTQQDLQHALSK